MSLQTIVNQAQQIEFDRGRIITATVSRSQRLKTAERNATQPWRWTVTPPASLPWSTSRSLVEAIDYADRDVEYTITLGNNVKQSYLVGYQGELDQTQLNAITINTFTNASLVLGNLPALGTTGTNGLTVSSSTFVLRAGDFVQPTNSRYPYTVVQDLVRGTGSLVTATTNRLLITSEGINPSGQAIRVGVDVSWRFVVLQKPSYSAVPYNRLQYNGDFVLMEKII
jgi:hypothetical protein